MSFCIKKNCLYTRMVILGQPNLNFISGNSLPALIHRKCGSADANGGRYDFLFLISPQRNKLFCYPFLVQAKPLLSYFFASA